MQKKSTVKKLTRAVIIIAVILLLQAGIYGLNVLSVTHFGEESSVPGTLVSVACVAVPTAVAAVLFAVKNVAPWWWLLAFPVQLFMFRNFFVPGYYLGIRVIGRHGNGIPFAGWYDEEEKIKAAFAIMLTELVIAAAVFYIRKIIIDIKTS